MPFIGSEEIPYHQQDSDDYCGAAVVQMMLAALGERSLPQQRDIYHAGYTGGSGGKSGTSPSELCDALNGYPLSKNRFCPQFDDKVIGCQRIAAALVKKMGVPVVVQTENHWNLVTGAQIEGDPKRPPYTIKGFYVHEPEPVTAAVAFAYESQDQRYSPPPPHKSPDHCGYGDYFGSANMYVTRYEWDNWYWPLPTGVFDEFGFITVCDREQPTPARPTLVQSVPEPKPASYDEGALKEVVRKSITDHGIDQEGPLAQRISGYTLGEITDHAQSDTSRRSRQISLMKGKHEVGRAAVDIGNREFLGVQAPPSKLIAPQEMMRFALEALKYHAAALSDLLGPGPLDNDRFSFDSAAFVWQPSRQSMSRYNPFIQVKLDETTLYVGMDRRVHRELAPHIRK